MANGRSRRVRAHLDLGQQVFVARLCASDEAAELPSDWLFLELRRGAWVICEHSAIAMALEATEAGHGDVPSVTVD